MKRSAPIVVFTVGIDSIRDKSPDFFSISLGCKGYQPKRIVRISMPSAPFPEQLCYMLVCLLVFGSEAEKRLGVCVSVTIQRLDS